ncbi:hypothetical protein MES4922_20121 [Mesorhizobium ventifaucium]|uniref:Uncharacterized protein n=1 Tax=Mesorhizobium ventifaucium TaxID=666020 RepID=A0ABM9DPB4_9HYPH|nr:hypothetical protein MES4922_20121 [Mesorhizobium ventifaucium]
MTAWSVLVESICIPLVLWLLVQLESPLLRTYRRTNFDILGMLSILVLPLFFFLFCRRSGFLPLSLCFVISTSLPDQRQFRTRNQGYWIAVSATLLRQRAIPDENYVALVIVSVVITVGHEGSSLRSGQVWYPVAVLGCRFCDGLVIVAEAFAVWRLG